jgi:hypothetical protein
MSTGCQQDVNRNSTGDHWKPLANSVNSGKSMSTTTHFGRGLLVTVPAGHGVVVTVVVVVVLKPCDV